MSTVGADVLDHVRMCTVYMTLRPYTVCFMDEHSLTSVCSDSNLKGCDLKGGCTVWMTL